MVPDSGGRCREIDGIDLNFSRQGNEELEHLSSLCARRATKVRAPAYARVIQKECRVHQRTDDFHKTAYLPPKAKR